MNLLKSTLKIAMYGFFVCATLFTKAQENINAQLLLTSPYDKEEIETLTPTLIWIALLSQPIINPGDAVIPSKAYKLIIVKLNEGQSATAGVSDNIPIFTSTNISLQLLIYPTSAIKLIEGGRYGWQLQEFTNGQKVNQSEAWEFRIKEKQKAHKFIMLKKSLDASICYYETDSKVYFVFEESYSNQILKSVLIDEKNTQKDINPTKVEESVKEGDPNDKVSYGNNKYVLDLMNLNIKKGNYILKIEAVDGTKYYQRIKIGG